MAVAVAVVVVVVEAVAVVAVAAVLVVATAAVAVAVVVVAERLQKNFPCVPSARYAHRRQRRVAAQGAPLPSQDGFFAILLTIYK